jgi:MFS family permease
MSRDLILVACSLLVWGFGEGAFFSFQPLYLQQLGADPIRIGAILSGYGLAQTLAHIPAGYLSDRIGRRPLMWAAWIFGLMATWMMALATTLPIFIIGMFLYGATTFVVSPMNSYITAARGRLSVGRTLTLISASYNTGAILGPLLGGWIGETYGFRTIFLFAALIFILSTVLILLIRPQPVETRGSLQHNDSIFKNTNYLGFMSLVFIAMFAMYLAQPLAPNFLQNERSLNLVAIGQLYSISALGIVLTNLILGTLDQRAGYMLGQVAVGIFAFLIWKQAGMIWYSLAFLFVGGYRTARYLALAQVQSLIHPANLGLAYGVSETISSSANILVPFLAGYLYNINPEIIFPISIALILISLIANGYYLFFRLTAPKDAITA